MNALGYMTQWSPKQFDWTIFELPGVHFLSLCIFPFKGLTLDTTSFSLMMKHFKEKFQALEYVSSVWKIDQVAV